MAGTLRCVEGMVRMVFVQLFRDRSESRSLSSQQSRQTTPKTDWRMQLWGFVLLAPVLAADVASAQQLPPPPQVSVPDLAPKSPQPPVNSGAASFGSPSLPEVSPNAVYRPPTVDRTIPRDRYIVYVNGNSPLLLQEVRKTVASAFLVQYQSRQVIQVGTFGDSSNAQRQVSTLAAQGIQADILTANTPLSAPNPMGTVPEPRAVPSSVTSSPAPGSPTSPNALNSNARYLVIIPAKAEDFPALTAEAIQLGIRADAIQSRPVPYGPHLEIGPFAQRTEAEEVNRYLRKRGLDARVFFNR